MQSIHEGSDFRRTNENCEGISEAIVHIAELAQGSEAILTSPSPAKQNRKYPFSKSISLKMTPSNTALGAHYDSFTSRRTGTSPFTWHRYRMGALLLACSAALPLKTP